MEEKWEEAVNKNQDGSGSAVILVTANVCTLLDEGTTPEDAAKGGKKASDVTGVVG